eukprot:6590333-Prorocentrum_lima.AAC.1
MRAHARDKTSKSTRKKKEPKFCHAILLLRIATEVPPYFCRNHTDDVSKITSHQTTSFAATCFYQETC